MKVKNMLSKFKFKTMSKKKKIIVTASCVVVIIIGISVTIFLRMPKKQITNVGNTYTRTTVLRKTSLAESISVTGTVESASVTNVTTDLNYKVSEILVQEGDKVVEGQTLCILDSTEIEKQIATKTENLSKSISEAEKSYNSAVTEKSSAYSKMVSAQSSMNSLSSTLQSVSSKYTTAKNSIASSQSVYNTAYSADEKAGIELNNATTESLESAQVKKNNTAEALRQAEEALRTAKDNVNYDDIEKEYSEATSSYERAVTEYESALSSYNKAAESVDSAYQKLTEASTSEEIEELQSKLEECTIVAATSGTITSVSATVGSMASSNNSSALFVIQDVDNLKVSLTIDEYDIKNIETNLKAKITSDATGDEEITGYVSQISQTASSAQGTSGGFGAQVTIDGIDSGLLIGMSVKVEIIVTEVDGIFTVPYDAVGKDENGNDIVYVKNGDEYEEVIVEVGMSTDYYIEISGADLEEGMEIRSSADETSIDAVEGSSSEENGNGMMDFSNMPNMDSSTMPSGGSMPSGGGDMSMPSGGGNGGQRGGN